MAICCMFLHLQVRLRQERFGNQCARSKRWWQIMTPWLMMTISWQTRKYLIDNSSQPELDRWQCRSSPFQCLGSGATCITGITSPVWDTWICLKSSWFWQISALGFRLRHWSFTTHSQVGITPRSLLFASAKSCFDGRCLSLQLARVAVD